MSAAMTRRAVLAGIGSVAFARGADAQAAWPNRPVRVIVPYPPAGGADTTARIVFGKLGEIYDNVRALNKDFCIRISHAELKDAGINAVVILDNFADMGHYAIDKDKLDKIKGLFKAYSE